MTEKSKRAPRTRETYEKALQAFRLSPGNAQAAARASGLDRKALARLWKEGWPGVPGAKPISVVLEEEQAEAARRSSVALKAEADARESMSVKAREASITTIEAERRLIEVGRTATIELARAAMNNRDLLTTLLDRVRTEAGTMAARDLAPLLRELRQLLGTIPTLATRLAEEGRAHRQEQGKPGAATAQAETPDLPPDALLEALEDAVHNLVQISRRGADAFWPGASWTPKEPFIADVRRLARGIGIALGPNEPHDLSPDDVGFEMHPDPPKRVRSVVVEDDDEAADPAAVLGSGDYAAGEASRREDGAVGTEEAPPARVLLLGDGRQVDGGPR